MHENGQTEKPEVTPAVNKFTIFLLFTEFLNQSLLNLCKFIEDNKKLKSWLWKMKVVKLTRTWILSQQKSPTLTLFLTNIYLSWWEPSTPSPWILTWSLNFIYGTFLHSKECRTCWVTRKRHITYPDFLKLHIISFG